jgi:CheY-like chemotaxis protein
MSGLFLITKDAGLIAAFVATALAVLLDLMPPGGMDSLQVCQAIRCDKTYIPTVMIIAPGCY